jgi:drug/metabolite transporter (DMT)-like permease
MLAVVVGIAMFFAGAETASATAPNPQLGNILGAASGLTYALMLAGLRWLARGSGANAGIATVALGNILACLCALPQALPVEAAAPGDLAVLAYLGTIQIGLAYVLLTRAIRYVPAFESTTLLITEPAMNPLWTWLVHGERPAAWSLAGGALILAATVVHTIRENRR